MLKLKALLLTQGMHGMISQVEGLAKALNLDFKHQTIKLKKFWNFVPPKLTPITTNVLSEKFICDAKIIISCGRKSVIPSIALKKQFGKNIFNIHIQNPKVALSNFDLVVCPKHDDLNGENILQTTGAIQYLTEKELEENIDYLKPRIKKEKVITFIAGGPNKYYDFNDEIIDKIFVKTKKNFINQGYQLIFIPSMRTPQRIIDKARNFFDDDQIIIQDIDKKAYLSSLKLANHIIVTCDSTSMISEAAMSGRPIYVAQMPAIKKNIRFKNFFELFKSLQIIKNLGDGVEEWNYKKLNETDRISGYIEKQFKNYDFS